MIIGIGVDTVDTARFYEWHIKTDAQLKRIFTASEIAYCRAKPLLYTQRFAVRFAAKEALFKALCTTVAPTLPFLTLCKATTIIKHPNGRPSFVIDLLSLSPYLVVDTQSLSLHLSLTHTASLATAFVLVEQKTDCR